MYEENIARPQSDFNMAVSYLGRLNWLLIICNDSAMNLNANLWYHALLALFREISTELKPAEKADMIKEKKELNQAIQDLNHKIKMTQIQEIPSDVYDRLDNFEMKIRKVLDESGLQKRMAHDPAAALFG